MNLSEITSSYNTIIVRRDSLKNDIEKVNKDLVQEKKVNEDLVKAKWVLTEVSIQIQNRFQDNVSRLVTTALRGVFDRPFEFQLQFERKRNQMECNPIIKEDDAVYDDPEYDLGGGLLDVSAFSSRIAILALQPNPTRQTILMDEPMKNMGELISLGGQVLREISHKANIQLIIMTHDKELIEIADRVFYVTHDGKKSHVEFKDRSEPEKKIEEVKPVQQKSKIKIKR